MMNTGIKIISLLLLFVNSEEIFSQDSKINKLVVEVRRIKEFPHISDFNNHNNLWETYDAADGMTFMHVTIKIKNMDTTDYYIDLKKIYLIDNRGRHYSLDKRATKSNQGLVEILGGRFSLKIKPGKSKNRIFSFQFSENTDLYPEKIVINRKEFNLDYY